MTCDERLEQLLNRAGQTISDLPTVKDYLTKNNRHIPKILLQTFDWDRYSHTPAQKRLYYIMHLTDIIDRMETALENVCGERDYLRSVVCGLCTNFHEDGADACETCIVGDGVPEYWSADDA